MRRYIKTDFREFILEKIKHSPVYKKEEIQEVEPDEILDYDEPDQEPEEEPIPDWVSDYEAIVGDDEEEPRNDDDLIMELHRKYKKLQRQYEHRLHQRKSRKTLR